MDFLGEIKQKAFEFREKHGINPCYLVVDFQTYKKLSEDRDIRPLCEYTIYEDNVDGIEGVINGERIVVHVVMGLVIIVVPFEEGIFNLTASAGLWCWRKDGNI